MTITQHAAAVSKQILPHHAMRHLRGLQVKAVTVKFSPQHHYTYTANSILQVPHHPIYERLKRTWQMRTDPLRWSVLVPRGPQTKKRVLRTYMMRKLRMAFTESLRRSGYARDGRILAGSAAETDLSGTVQLSASEELLQMNLECLQAQTDKIVEKMMQEVASFASRGG